MGLGFVYWFCEKLGKGVWRIMISIFRAITWLSSQLVPRIQLISNWHYKCGQQHAVNPVSPNTTLTH